MCTISATYSPEDNKLRLYASTRLDSVTFAEVKAAGFIWAPKQDLFVAPAWTPEREALALALAGEIGDEDTTLCERAEARADRFEDYSEARADDAEAARRQVERIADGIPFGQPILVGHHSERHARKDAERIETGMRRAVNAWETSRYWAARAAGAIRAAKYKERPDVRARRIKGLESDERKHAKGLQECETMARIWGKVPRLPWDEQTAAACYIAGRVPGYSAGGGFYSALHDGKMHGDEAWRRAVESCERSARWHREWLRHIGNRLTYERAMLAEAGGLAADRFDIVPGGRVLVGGLWSTVIRVNKSGGRIVSVSTNSRSWPRVPGIEEISDYQAPTAEAAAAVEAAAKLPPLVNYRTPGAVEMTAADYTATYRDYRTTKVHPATDEAAVIGRLARGVAQCGADSRGGSQQVLRRHRFRFGRGVDRRQGPVSPGAQRASRRSGVPASVQRHALLDRRHAGADPVSRNQRGSPRLVVGRTARAGAQCPAQPDDQAHARG